MTTCPTRSVLAQMLRALILLLLILSIGPALPGDSSSAWAQDEIGIFWDDAYTQDNLDVDPVPGIVTGHLVLKNPVSTAGLRGWELCISVDGAGQFMFWDIAGQNINLNQPPCFVVGLAEPLLPVGDSILLASFQFMATDVPPVVFSVHPTPIPSLPGQMAYVPADRLNDLVPLSTVSGTAEVARLNANNPWLEVSTDALSFGVLPIGGQSTRVFTVTNAGGGILEVDLALSAGCEGFSLPGYTGPISLPIGASTAVTVNFDATEIRPYNCQVEFAGFALTVDLWGEGRAPIFAYTVSTTRYFGEVGVGSFRDVTSVLSNTGEVPIAISPTLLGCGDDYTIVAGGEPQIVAPSTIHLLNVRFQPLVPGINICALSFADSLDQVELNGIGRDPLLEFVAPAAIDFGTVSLGSFVDRSVVIRNIGEGAFPLVPGLVDCGSEFSILAGGDSLSLAPSTSHTVFVRFIPSSLGAASCSLALGDVVPAVDLTGAGREPVLSFNLPTSASFAAEVGQVAFSDITIHNTGDVAFGVVPSLQLCEAEYAIVAGGEPLVLQAQTNHTVRVRYQPTKIGPFECALALGDTQPDVALLGTATAPTPSWVVSPSPLNFAATGIGEFREANVNITNTGVVDLNLDIVIPGEPGTFSIVSGGGALVLTPGLSHAVTVHFEPTVEGWFEAFLNFGYPVPPVALQGFGGAATVSCEVTPAHLDYGSQLVGAQASRTITVTNTGNQPLPVAPVSNSAVFQVLGGPSEVAPGLSVVYSIYFESAEEGFWEGAISLNAAGCSSVTCAGTTFYPVVAGTNQLGIFFDEGLSVNETNLPAFVPTDAYLALFNASDPSGVSGWECTINVHGEALILGTSLEGQALNIAAPPSFIVGLASPLPPGTAVTLARMTFLLVDPYTVVLFELGPVDPPSLPGQMAWVSGGSPALIPMYPLGGDPIVATINGGSPVAVAAPTPELALNGGQVHLTWPTPVDEQAECHVYRRTIGVSPERLTDLPLSTTGGTLQFTDDPQGFAPGMKLLYSYAIVLAGQERARSPEVEFTIPSLPMISTRLLPNVPNPFNPQTEIRFELGRPGQVRVAIYDVTGRVVRTLVNTRLDTGPHTRVWQGRDDSGRSVSSGAYYVRMTVEGKVDHRKIMLLK